MKKTDYKQDGFTLIELMIAVALSATLLFGVLQIFDANRQSTRLQQGFSEVQESGRIATELIARDIRMADFWGCAPSTDDVLDHLDTSDADYDTSMSVTGTDGVSGQDDVGSGVTVGSIAVKEATDILTLKGSYTLSNVRVETPYMTVASAMIHINSGVDIPLGKILMITDCAGGDLFSNTATNTSSSGNIIHSTGNLPTSGMVNNAFKPLSHTYTANAQIVVPFAKIYFVGQNPEGGWSLYRSDDGVVNELVENIDDLQFVYGEDSNDNQSADTFGVAGVIMMDDVVSIRTVLVAESNENVISGSPLSRSYTVTANIRNRTL